MGGIHLHKARRILGEHVLTIDEVVGHARFPDGVGLNCRAIELNIRFCFLKKMLDQTPVAFRPCDERL